MCRVILLDVAITGGLPQTTESAVIKLTVCKVTAVKLSPGKITICFLFLAQSLSVSIYMCTFIHIQ